MLGALGSPIRSPAAFQRQLRSAPASPLPLSAHRALPNISAAGGGSGSNTLPQGPGSPTTPTRAAPLSPALSGFQPLHNGAATNLSQLLLLPSSPEERQIPGGSGLRNYALPAAIPELGGPSGLLDMLLPASGHAVAVAGNGAKIWDGTEGPAFASGLFPPDPDDIAARLPPPPFLPPEPQPPPQINLNQVFAPAAGRDDPAAAVPPAPQVPSQAMPRLQQLQRMDDQLQQHWHIWAQLLQQVQQQMLHMHQHVHQAQQMHQEMQMEVQALQQQAVQPEQLVQELAGPEAPAALPAAAAAAGVAPAEEVPAPAPAAPAEAPAEVPVAKPHSRDPNTDLEPGVWLVKEEPQQQAAEDVASSGSNRTSETVMVFLRSLDSKKRTRVLFANESGRSVTAFWLNYAGQEVPYGTLLSGQAKVYETYVSHPWIFRCSTSGSRMLAGSRMSYYAEELAAPSGSLGLGLGRRATRQPQLQRVVIKAPPPLTHSRETHAAFPEDYKASSRALLLAHQRLQRPDLQAAAAATAAAAAAARRTLADTMGRAFRTAVGALLLAAEPAMQAIGVWGPSAGDSDTCRMRWLDGTALGEAHAGSQFCDQNESVRRSSIPGSPDVARRTVSSVAPDAAIAVELLAPGSVQMHAQSPQRNMVSGAGGATDSAIATPRLSGKQFQRRVSTSPCNLPIRTAAGKLMKANTEAENSVPVLGELLAELPRDLVHLIIHFMAPAMTQHVALHPRGHPDILPALLPSDPATWAPIPAAAEQNA